MRKAFEKIIERLKEKRKGYLSAYVQGIDDAIAIVKETAAEYNNGWILCSSGKLPEEFVDVDVTIEETQESGEKEYYTSQSWMQDGIWIAKRKPKRQKVIAWKYPAEPYIPKEN